jgi:hypothetical protein
MAPLTGVIFWVSSEKTGRSLCFRCSMSASIRRSRESDVSSHSDKSEAPNRRGLLRGLATTGAAAVAGGALLGTPTSAAAAASTVAGVIDPFAPDVAPSTGRVREYWIKAESFTHSAVPNGYDGMMGTHFIVAQTTFTAIGFRAYTRNWGRALPSDFGPEGIGGNTGIPGPTIRAEVGDVIKVHFRNEDHHYKWPHSMSLSQ